MKIAIFPNYGGVYIPPFLEKQLTSDNWVRRRIELAEIIETLQPTHKKITPEIYKKYQSSLCLYDKIQENDYIKDEENNDVIYVLDKEDKFGYVYKIQIEDVDTNNIWKIDDYDGAEGIEYYYEPQIVDKEINYGEW